jgi:ABC-type transport system involved in Fe-S cluster assembly fused permease/ATPase subunit
LNCKQAFDVGTGVDTVVVVVVVVPGLEKNFGKTVVVMMLKKTIRWIIIRSWR